MVQISGKYKLVENKNFYELLLAFGVPEEKAKQDDKERETLEVSVDGDKITTVRDIPKRTNTLVVGKEVEEQMGEDRVVLSTTKLDGNVVTVTSKTKDGSSTGSRTMTFSDSGLEVVANIPKDGKTYTATRIYKRI